MAKLGFNLIFSLVLLSAVLSCSNEALNSSPASTNSPTASDNEGTSEYSTDSNQPTSTSSRTTQLTTPTPDNYIGDCVELRPSNTTNLKGLIALYSFETSDLLIKDLGTDLQYLIPDSRYGFATSKDHHEIA